MSLSINDARRSRREEAFSPHEIKAVTFDAGGTLFEPWPSVGAVYAQVAREFGLECCPEILTQRFGAAWQSRPAFRYTRAEWRDVVCHSFSGQAEISVDLFNAIYERFCEPASWRIFDDVLPTLQRIEKLGLKLAVISNWDDRLEPLLEKLGLAPYFDHIVVSGILGIHKPDPGVFAHAAGQLNVPPQNILHLGDSLREDVRGAQGAGLKSWRIRRSGRELDCDMENLTDAALEKAINRKN